MRLFILLLFFLSMTACSDRQGQDSQSDRPTPEVALNSDGTERGNGAEDHLLGDNSAWFADPSRTIRYCIDVSPSFGIPAANINALVPNMFKKWSDYINSITGSALKKTSSEVSLAIKSELLEQCDGVEDLKFLFGARSPEVDSAVSAFTRPWGFGKRTSYDYSSRWGKGFIWIREQGGLGLDAKNRPVPDWSLEGSIEGIILHELGHVYGIGHFQGTIMRQDITKILQNIEVKNPDHRQKFTTEIDQENQLYSRPFGVSTYQGKIGVGVYDRSQDEAQALFLRLTGRSAKGAISAQAKKLGLDMVKLQLKDAEGTYDIDFEPVKNSLMNTCVGQTLFNILEDPNSRSSVGSTFCYSYNAQLVLADGENKLVQVIHNQNAGLHQPDSGSLFSDRLVIKLIENSHDYLLFVSTF